MNNRLPKYAVVLLLGILMFLTGAKSIYDIVTYTNEWNDFQSHCVSTHATVTSVKSFNGFHEHVTHTFLKYEAENGKEYISSIDKRCDGFVENADVIIYYDKDHPKNIMVEPEVIFKWDGIATAVCFILGTVLVIGGLILKRYENG